MHKYEICINLNPQEIEFLQRVHQGVFYMGLLFAFDRFPFRWKSEYILVKTANHHCGGEMGKEQSCLRSFF